MTTKNNVVKTRFDHGFDKYVATIDGQTLALCDTMTEMGRTLRAMLPKMGITQYYHLHLRKPVVIQ